MTYNNSNSGALFKNERKRPDRQDPDYTGTAELGGVAYYVDAWVNDIKDKPGRKFLKLKFKAKDQPAAAKPQAAPEAFVDDSDIPF